MSNELIAARGVYLNAKSSREALCDNLRSISDDPESFELEPGDTALCDCGGVLIKNTSLLLEGRLFCPKCLTACDRSEQFYDGAMVNLEGQSNGLEKGSLKCAARA